MKFDEIKKSDNNINIDIIKLFYFLVDSKLEIFIFRFFICSCNSLILVIYLSASSSFLFCFLNSYTIDDNFSFLFFKSTISFSKSEILCCNPSKIDKFKLGNE